MAKSITHVRPKMWNIGRIPMTFWLLENAPASSMNRSSDCCTLATRLRCVSIAPLETPVVPPVYCSAATSSTGSMVTWGAGGGVRLARKSPKEW